MNMLEPVSRHDLEIALVAERNYSHALLQALPIGVCTIDVNGRVVSLNPEAERVLGWSEVACVGSELHELIGCVSHAETGDEPGCPIQWVLDTGKPAWSTHTSVCCRDGTTKQVE